MGKVVTGEWRKAKNAKLEFAFVSAFSDNSSFGLNILGPLCLWHCFITHLFDQARVDCQEGRIQSWKENFINFKCFLFLSFFPAKNNVWENMMEDYYHEGWRVVLLVCSPPPPIHKVDNSDKY